MLFYKIYFLKLNLIIFSILLDTFLSFALNLITSLILASLENSINIINSSNKIIFSEAFANKSEKKKKEKKKKDKKIASKNKKEKKEINKKENKKREFR